LKLKYILPLLLPAVAALAGDEPKAKPKQPARPEAPRTIPDDFQPDPSWKALGRSLWFDPAQKRLVLRARVALREGALEHLLCREQTKEHESILATDASPRMIHAGLILTGAQPGHPVRFQPKFEPPAGTPITIELEWTSPEGERQKANARQWVRDVKTRKPLDTDWVFAGSDLFEDPDTKQTIYAADGGDLFTVSNFTASILDLPFASSADDTSRGFEADPRQVPPRGTHVTMSLRPATAHERPKARRASRVD